MKFYSEEEKQELIIRYCSECMDLNTHYSVLFEQWLNSGDPDYLDKMIMDMNRDGLQIKGLILEQMAIASFNRLLREYSYTKKTRINIDILDEQTYFLIFKLIHFCHKKRDEATFLMAGLLDAKYPLASKKASYLDKQYSKWSEENVTHIDYVKSLKPDGWTIEEQDTFMNNFPNKISPALRGNRRE